MQNGNLQTHSEMCCQKNVISSLILPPDILCASVIRLVDLYSCGASPPVVAPPPPSGSEMGGDINREALWPADLVNILGNNESPLVQRRPAADIKLSPSAAELLRPKEVRRRRRLPSDSLNGSHVLLRRRKTEDEGEVRVVEAEKDGGLFSAVIPQKEIGLLQKSYQKVTFPSAICQCQLSEITRPIALLRKLG